MVSSLATAIAAGPVGRTYGKLRDSRLITALIWNWIIPSTLVAMIVVAISWAIVIAE
jgi:hypothetical protein